MNFKDFVAGKRIAAVGPAPSVIGSKQKESIDGYDLVMRFNKACPVPSEVVADTGNRCDIICNCLEPMAKSGGHLDPNIWKTNGVKWVLSAYPKDVWFNKGHAANFQRKLGNRLPMEFPPDKEYVDFQTSLGTRPNSGLCGIWYLLSLPIKEIYVTGFTFGRGGYHKGYFDTISPEQYEKLANGPHHKQEPQRLYFKKLLANEPRLKVDEPMRAIIEE
jgi:hypothetical protein